MGRRRGILWLLTLAACGAPRLESSMQTIQGGTEDESHTYAIGLRLNETSLCSGTLIASNLVLTARHCIAERSTSTDCEKATFGKVTSVAGISASTCTDLHAKDCVAWYGVKEIMTPDGTAACGQDIALLILSTNITTVTPATPLLDSLAATSPFTAIGFGKPHATTGTTGVRRVRKDIDMICAPGYSAPKYDCSKMGKYLSDNDFLSGAGVCPGDSGAGAFDQDSVARKAPLAIGVASRGWGDAEDNCTYMIFNELAPHASLIRTSGRKAANAGAYPTPSWVTNVGDAGTPPVKKDRDAGSQVSLPVSADAAPDAAAETKSSDPPASCAVSRGDRTASWIAVLFVAGLLRKRASRVR